MSLRTMLGLCEHRWSIEQSRIEHSVGVAQGYAHKIVTGYTIVKECDRCHAVKGFRI